MALTGKMEYIQTDGALSETMQAFTFSIDGGTTTLKPRKITVKNTETSGSKVVICAVNSGTTAVKTLAYGESYTFADLTGRPIKQFQLKRDSAGAPNYRVSAEV